MLKSLNQKLGSAIYISDLNNYNNYGLQGRAMGLTVAYVDAKTENFKPIDIDFQKMKVQSEISIKFKIE